MFLICTFLFSLSCPVLWMSETGQSVSCILSMRIFRCVRAFCTHVFVSIPITVWFGPLFHPLSFLIKRELNLSSTLFSWFCMEELIRAISASQWGQNMIFYIPTEGSLSRGWTRHYVLDSFMVVLYHLLLHWEGIFTLFCILCQTWSEQPVSLAYWKLETVGNC